MAELADKLQDGTYHIPKTIKLSLEGASFMNELLQIDPEQRIAWNDLISHQYLQSEEFDAIDDSMLNLSYMPDSKAQ
jgi:serine/threonine protein kinase